MNQVPCTLAVLKAAFPRHAGCCAVVGRMSIEFFTDNETEIREVMRAHRLRAIYRGPRVSNNVKYSFSVPSMTRRCDATHVMLYMK